MAAGLFGGLFLLLPLGVFGVLRIRLLFCGGGSCCVRRCICGVLLRLCSQYLELCPHKIGILFCVYGCVALSLCLLYLYRMASYFSSLSVLIWGSLTRMVNLHRPCQALQSLSSRRELCSPHRNLLSDLPDLSMLPCFFCFL